MSVRLASHLMFFEMEHYYSSVIMLFLYDDNVIKIDDVAG